MAGVQERFARLRESVRLMRELWGGERVDFDGEFYHLKGASIYDVPRRGAGLHRRRRPAVAKYAGRAETVSSAPPARAALHRQADAGRRRGAAGPGRDLAAIDKMIERSRSPTTPTTRPRWEHPVLGPAVPDARAEAQRVGPDRDGAAGRRTSHRPGGPALDRHRRP